MRPRSVLLAGLLVLAGGGALAPVAGEVAAVGTAVQADNRTEASLGTQLSSFMQASSAETNGSVDSGMWAAEFTQSTTKDREVHSRVSRLERRLDRLETRMEQLEQRRAAGDLTEGVYLAQASRLAAEAASLRAAINETETAATTAGVNDTRLETLREEAADASGRAVASAARNLTVVRPEDPSDDAPNPEDVPPGLSEESETDAESDERGRDRPEQAERNETEAGSAEAEADADTEEGLGSDRGQGPAGDDSPEQADGDTGEAEADAETEDADEAGGEAEADGEDGDGEGAPPADG